MAMGPSANNISSQPLHAAGLRTAAEGAALWIGIGQAGIEPVRRSLAEGVGLVEEHHAVPLRALGFVDGERVAVSQGVAVGVRFARGLVIADEEVTMDFDVNVRGAAVLSREPERDAVLLVRAAVDD